MNESPLKKSALAGRPPGMRTCPQCGAHFVCGTEAGEKHCWCAALPHITIDPQLPGCLCPACLQQRIDAASA
ncbi:hypothetical protein MASR1M60_18780 [Rhodocyclaceae bacterium]